ncbi:MAG: thiol-disulfide oxidoreductase [Ponticaulis sp.]|nr:thiol-disulfide oxidoreductase [Ponticaulis sp.]|tara:strand:- start:28511 stop:28894 length:384 start_codon:yes stop_codon:yes gene_type:complete
MTNASRLTVFYDGACPLCIREIGLLRRLEKDRRIDYLDVSPPGAAEFCPIPQKELMARFTVKRADGALVSGAQAFTEAWSQIPWLIWLRPIGRFPPTRWVLDLIYSGFLKIRPGLQRWVKRRLKDAE